MRAQDYQPFCLTDSVYYESPERLDDGRTLFGRPEIPQGWQERSRGLWTILRPEAAALPEQGWKIHVSATPANAQKTLEMVWPRCVDAGVAFKFLRSRDAVLYANAKYADRSSSGKFITVYPPDDRRFAALLTELDADLAGLEGPYILTDLRYRSGPVYVRYGAFTEQWCDGPDGTRVPAIRHPDGHLMEDDRRLTFTVPEWVVLPKILEPSLRARDGSAEDDFPYSVTEALHFSNAGGVYRATSRIDGEDVVLREARPYAGYDGDGADAVTRLRREHDILKTLEGLSCVPRVVDYRIVWEHHFLVEEYIEGTRLLDEVIQRYPLVLNDPEPSQLAEYASWAQDVAGRVSEALDAVHRRGVRFGDLHPGNIIVRPDGSVVLVDFEIAGDLNDDSPAPLGAPGFTAPRGATGLEADRHALDAVRLMLWLPLVEVTAMDETKTNTLLTVAEGRFGVDLRSGPGSPGSGGRRRHLPGPDLAADRMRASGAESWPSIRDWLAAGILDSATPQRPDRLYPADPMVFVAGAGASLAHGAAGVLLALGRAGVRIPREHLDWLEHAALRDEPDRRYGLYDGLLGAALVLRELGRPLAASRVLDRCREEPAPAGAGLFSGRSGVALAFLHLAVADGDRGLLRESLAMGDQLAELVYDPAWAAEPGLLHGASGVALLMLRQYEVTGDDRYLDHAEHAVMRDFAHCVEMADGTVQIRAGNRHLLYLDGGSAGPALVATAIAKHRDNAALAGRVEGVRRGCANEFVRQPGLFQGRAGLIAALAGMRRPGDDPTLAAQVTRLGWHAVLHRGHVSIPGTHLLRLSADLATGAAGVLWAVNAALAGPMEALPFLGPVPPRRSEPTREAWPAR